jgi:hypothetical protein
MNQPLTVTFGGTITGNSLSSITISPAISGVTSVINGNMLTIRHDDFAPLTTYTVKIPASAIADLSGDIVWTFTTKALEVIEDSKHPTPESIVNEGVMVIVKFDGAVEIIQPAGITISPALSEPIVAEAVNINTLNIKHSAFTEGTTYTVTIAAGASKGLQKEVTWKFSVNNTVLSITGRTPGIEEIDVEPDAKVEVTFSAPVAVGSSLEGITIKSVDGEIDIKLTFDATRTILTIGHDNFEYDTQYTITIPKEAINGLMSIQKWSFTTCSEPPLQVSVLTPAEDATDVELNVEVIVAFNKDITLGNTLDKNYFAPSVDIKEVSQTSNKFIITTNGFEPDVTYTVTIPAGTIAGFSEVITWSFTTKSPSLTGIEIEERLEAKLFPNPVITGAQFTVQVEQNNNIPLVVEIFTATGVLLQKTEAIDPQFQMTAPNAVGVYLLRISNGKSAGVYRLVVQ